MIIETSIFGNQLSFHTNKNLFSAAGIDKGTLAMLDIAEGILAGQEKILDLGCGYGAVGIAIAKIIGAERVYMSDSDKLAVETAKKNAVLNGVGDINIIQSAAFTNIGEKDFTLILSNPPYHADFSVPKEFIEKGFNRLALDGSMLMVTKRLAWYKNKLSAIFGGVKVTEVNGYYIFSAEKRRVDYANRRRKRF